MLALHNERYSDDDITIKMTERINLWLLREKSLARV